jgi:hypothetical protein
MKVRFNGGDGCGAGRLTIRELRQLPIIRNTDRMRPSRACSSLSNLAKSSVSR